jgi:hypothetical protein
MNTITEVNFSVCSMATRVQATNMSRRAREFTGAPPPASMCRACRERRYNGCFSGAASCHSGLTWDRCPSLSRGRCVRWPGTRCCHSHFQPGRAAPIVTSQPGLIGSPTSQPRAGWGRCPLWAVALSATCQQRLLNLNRNRRTAGLAV